MQTDPQKLDGARKLRRDATPPERAMWTLLLGHRLSGWKFTRQVNVGPYFLDFAARRERLAIELDGDTHAGRETYDAERTSHLESKGWRVLRFTNRQVQTNPEGVAIMILQALPERRGPSPRPSPRRGEGG